MYHAHHDVLLVLHARAKVDPGGAGQAIARSEGERANGMAWLAGRLHEQGFLRPELDPAAAAHVIWLLASFDAYDLLATGRGLAPAEIVDILAGVAQRALLA
jgi:hypothetical protein